MKTVEGYEADTTVASTDLEIDDSGTMEHKRYGIERYLPSFAQLVCATTMTYFKVQTFDADPGRLQRGVHRKARA